MSTKRRSPAKLAAPVVKANARRPTKTTIDEGRTTVSGAEILHGSLIGSTKEAPLVLDSDQDLSDDEEDAQDGEAEAVDTMDVAVRTNGRPSSSERVEAEGQEDQGEGGEEEPTSPSFGELLRRDGAVIDVSAMLKKPATPDAPAAATALTGVSASALAVHDGGADSKTEEGGGGGKVVRPTHQSLVTVLSQALSTDDADLLESCLQTTDLVTVRNTIEGIDSALAGLLLHKLAARMHRRPGRVGTLMTWVQWTLIAHGGALAAQPRAVHSLGSLRKVLVERAKGLNSLLALKGKLDILEGQMELRKKMQTSSKRNRRDGSRQEDGKRGVNGQHSTNSNHIEDGSDDNVIYVEDEEEAGDEEDGAVTKRRLRGANDDDDEEEEYYDDNLLNNAVLNEFAGLSEDEEDKSEKSESDDARGGEDEDGDEVDFDDVDEESVGGAAEEEDESEGEAAPPAKVQKVKKNAFGKRK